MGPPLLAPARSLRRAIRPAMAPRRLTYERPRAPRACTPPSSFNSITMVTPEVGELSKARLRAAGSHVVPVDLITPPWKISASWWETVFTKLQIFSLRNTSAGVVDQVSAEPRTWHSLSRCPPLLCRHTRTCTHPDPRPLCVHGRPGAPLAGGLRGPRRIHRQRESRYDLRRVRRNRGQPHRASRASRATDGSDSCRWPFWFLPFESGLAPARPCTSALLPPVASAYPLHALRWGGRRDPAAETDLPTDGPRLGRLCAYHPQRANLRPC